MRLAASIAAVLALIALPAIVLGHASLVTADPTAGATVTTPYTLTDTFAEEADPMRSTLTVENASGTVVATGTVNATDQTKITAALPALPNGTYTVRWTTVTSDDNGVERGTYTFNVGSSSATPAPTPSPSGGASDSGNNVLIAVGIAAVLIVVVVALVIFRGRR